MIGTQPKIDVKPTKTDRLLIRIGWVLVLLHFIVLFIFYFDLPNTMPTHFNLKGEADGFSSKNDLWALPILSLIIYYGVGKLITNIKPWHYNYPTKVTEQKAPYLYALSIHTLVWLNLCIVLTFFVVSMHSILLALDLQSINLSWLILCLLGFLTLYPFVVIFKLRNTPKT